MSESSSTLPFGSEFSPSQIDLAELLTIVEAHEGDRGGMAEAIRSTFFPRHADGDRKAQLKLATNCVIGLKSYRLIDDASMLTDFGQELCRVRKDTEALHAALATHILLHLQGMNVLQCVRDMNAAGESINLVSLRRSLAVRGIHFPQAGKHASMMRLWLEKAGVLAENSWQIDEGRVSALVGQAEGGFAEMQNLSAAQRAFLRALAGTLPSGPQPANDIARLAAAVFGVRFPEKSLAKDILQPLVKAGFITAQKTTTGRGAKPFRVEATPKLVSDVVDPLLAQLEARADRRVIELLRRSMADVLEAISSSDRHVAGLGLEALAFKLMMLLDLTYVATRLREESTGGAEVDLVFESARLVFSRWQVQCKNTARVSLDDVAKEVGLTHFLKANVILVVTTGKIGAAARKFADKIMVDSNLCIALLDGEALERIADEPAHLVDALTFQAKHAQRLKILDIVRGD